MSARGGRILFLDADGATEIKDMSRLEKAIDEVTTDYNVPAVAVGSRAHLQDEAVAKVHAPPTCNALEIWLSMLPYPFQRSQFRNFLMYGFHFLVYALCVRGIQDTQCGFKMMTRASAASLFQLMHIDRW